MNSPTSQRSSGETSRSVLSQNKLDFDFFLRQLRSRKADPILRYIRSFMKAFIQKGYDWTVDEQAKLVQDFRDFIFQKLPLFEPFSLMNDTELQNAKFGVEKLIMTKLYEYCYSPMIPSNKLNQSHRQTDIEPDEVLELNYKSYSLMTPQDLDVDEVLIKSGDFFIKSAADELNKVSNYKGPRAKTVCLLNACKILFQLIKKSEQNQNADEFLPLLIYTVLKGRIHNLYSNLNYIDRFSFIKTSESQYYLVSLFAAAEFIKNLSSSN